MTNIGKKKSCVVMNSPFLEEEKGNTDTNYLRKKFNISNKTKIFLYIGILSKGRGIDLALQFFLKTKKDAVIIFLGYGELTEKIINLSSSSKNIFFHKAVKHKNVVPIAKSADFGLCLIENVSLSDYFSLPNKLFEYTFAGLPVVASNFPDISKLVKKYNLGICTDVDFDSFASVLDLIVSENIDFKFKTSSLRELSWQSQSQVLSTQYKNYLS